MNGQKTVFKVLRKGLLLVLLIAIGICTQIFLPKWLLPKKEKITLSPSLKPFVLSASSAAIPGLEEIGYRIPVTFNSDAIFKGNIIINGKQFRPEDLNLGSTPSVTASNPVTVINNTGVLSLQGQAGALELTTGNGIGLNGLSITNTDPGSGQNIFKKVEIPGVGSFTAGSNNDTFSLSAGDGIALSIDQNTKNISISQKTVTGLTDKISFSDITAGINSDTLTIGNGSSLSTSGTGVINANQLLGNTWAAPGTIGISASSSGAFTLLRTSGQNVFSALGSGIAHIDSSGLLSSSAVNLGGSDVMGILPLDKGGTGADTAEDARMNLGLVSGGSGDIWVKRAGDTMTGDLTISKTFPKLYLNTTQTLYLPNQADFTGTLVVGNGGGSLSHVTGDDGRANTFVGINSGLSNTRGHDNLAFGSGALYSNTTGNFNSAFGTYALYFNTTGSSNLGLSKGALFFNLSGNDNLGLGINSLLNNITGSNNISIGTSAFFNNTSTNNNIGIGRDTGYFSQTGSNNIFIGHEAAKGVAMYAGAQNNIAMGFQAGYNMTSGSSNNVLIGYQAGYSETGSNKLYIANSNTTAPLIYGDFSANTLTINGNFGVGINNPGFKFDIRDLQSATAAAQIYNNSASTDADGLIIKLGNTSPNVVTSNNHFLSFETAGIGIVGSIQGNGSRGIQLAQNGIADYAEYLPKEKTAIISDGSLLCMQANGLVAECTKDENNIVGVSSPNPLIIGGYNLGDGSVAVGLTGIVETQVSSVNGLIKPGDMISVSDTAGVGAKAKGSGMVVGRALEAYEADVPGKVKVLVNPVWYTSTEVMANIANPVLSLAPIPLPLSLSDTSDATVSGSLSVLGRSVLSDVGITGKVNIGLLSINGLDGCACATINTSSGFLMLQSQGLNGIDMMNGKITVDTKGNLTVKETVIAKKYAVDTTDKKSTSFGEAELLAGEMRVTIGTTAVAGTSGVFLTPENEITSPLFIVEKKQGISFTVGISKPEPQDVKFNWWVVN